MYTTIVNYQINRLLLCFGRGKGGHRVLLADFSSAHTSNWEMNVDSLRFRRRLRSRLSYLGEVLNFNTASTFTCFVSNSWVGVTFKYFNTDAMTYKTKVYCRGRENDV